METAAAAASVSEHVADHDALIQQILEALSTMTKYRLETCTERLWTNRVIQSLPSCEPKIGAEKLQAVLKTFQNMIADAKNETNKSQEGGAVALSVATVQTLRQQAPEASLPVAQAVMPSVQPATRIAKGIKQNTMQKLNSFRQFAFDYIKKFSLESVLDQANLKILNE